MLGWEQLGEGQKLHAYDGHAARPVCGVEGVVRRADDKFPRTTYHGPMPPPKELRRPRDARVGRPPGAHPRGLGRGGRGDRRRDRPSTLVTPSSTSMRALTDDERHGPGIGGATTHRGRRRPVEERSRPYKAHVAGGWAPRTQGAGQRCCGDVGAYARRSTGAHDGARGGRTALVMGPIEGNCPARQLQASLQGMSPRQPQGPRAQK